jgi:hypothetical protein
MATTARFTDGIGVINAGKDNTDRILDNQYLTPAYAATIALKPTKSYTLVNVATLTGAVTFTATVGSSSTPPYVGDVIDFMLVSDGTTRTATFGTGFQVNGTFAVTTGKYGAISFRFNGTYWIETSRVVTA